MNTARKICQSVEGAKNAGGFTHRLADSAYEDYPSATEF